jgi:hypothetical protein
MHALLERGIAHAVGVEFDEVKVVIECCLHYVLAYTVGIVGICLWVHGLFVSHR